MTSRLFSIFLLTFFSPIILIILLITFFDLKANPIFVQDRVIDGSRIFKFYKIRTMKKSAPQVATNLIESPHLFITKWGKFLRTTSIDEVLNLISIVKGDMNFIGPRPIMVNEIELIEYRKRNGISSKGGVTGLAQIEGRDYILVTRKIAAERYYESKKNFLLDVSIILKTIYIVLKRSGISH
jgi:O-antigen biosynthesis protein WbqP